MPASAVPGGAGEQVMAKPRKMCQHCRTRFVNRSRDLCWECYYTPDIKALYRPKNRTANDPEPTMAELDAMIAEQMQCLPKWWRKDVRRQRRLER